MQPQSIIYQRTAPLSDAARPQAPTLAPLRFIIPNSHGINSFSGVGVATFMSSTNQFMNTTIVEPEYEPLPQHSLSLSQDCSNTTTRQQQLSPKGGGQLDISSQLKKITPKRSRTPKLSSRSTKSKARPGLRKGKWTEEESRYAAQLTKYFKKGLLPIERGTMLRLYLSQKLNCEPMRITKKFTGGECIGKQVFRPCSLTPESRLRIMQAQVELVALEAAFLKRLKENREDPPIPTKEFDVQPASSNNRPQPVLLKPRMYKDVGDIPGGDVDDAKAVGLLLDFFYKAHHNEKKSGKCTSASKSDEGTNSDDTENEDDHNQEESVNAAAPTSPSTTSANIEETDPAINSPTKRMRALSVSGYVDPVTAKRSRIGSFSTVTAA
ncbi:uncharacterized protein PHALS_08047 [Plasmopara halstedii]|uniref:Homeodomain-like n=1 Tax=Plasmopara halstedii TaxID=4781 RepID=A0A0P1B900_PLAHL|nr:uncharacterized protein PHALS_08047 [Plasmopara halstedii]CEG50328.1 hypothetical protein PHALS_08047 [Plasmopara halstedii]|eukprot:XP_024586697.1 hypothetical protein PHALS_08047 [Plasmopara halstedii]